MGAGDNPKAMFSFLSSLPLPLVALSLAFSIGLCVHVIRTHQPMYWLWIILAFQPLGGLVYFVAILLPGWTGGTAARRMGSAVGATLDPGRDYRTAKAAYDDIPTVQNMMKLAEASSEMGRWDEAESFYGRAAQGLYADDPALLLGRARALVELNRPAEALEPLDHLAKLGPPPPQADLVRARALDALGRMSEAERAYKSAFDRLPGLEAIARYAAFLNEIGRKDEARELLKDLNARAAKTRGPFRREAAIWRDYATSKIGA
jgi:hypothetical protein